MTTDAITTVRTSSVLGAPPLARSALGAGPTGTRAPRPVAAENATIVEREDISASVARFVVRPDGPMLPFRAGQYLAAYSLTQGGGRRLGATAKGGIVTCWRGRRLSLIHI